MDIPTPTCTVQFMQFHLSSVVSRIVASAFVLMSAVPSACSAQTALPESSSPTIEYDDVSAAWTALKAKQGVTFTVVNGWDIATDQAARAVWSFSPQDYAAYPAVVKRQVVEESGQVFIKMSVHCEASKAACDDLVRTFSRMNGFELPQ